MKITSISNPKVQYWLTLKKPDARKEVRLFLLEGEKLIKEAYALNLIETLIYQENLPEVLAKVKEIYQVDKKVISKLSNLTSAPNLIAVCKIPEYQFKYPEVILALDGVQDPGNGGSILRSALGFGIKHMLLSQSSFDPYNDKFIRATMGAFFKVKVERLKLVKKLSELKKAGYKIITTSAVGKTQIKPSFLKEKLVIVLGAEGQGISAEITTLSDFDLSIKINPELESLNVSAAAAILLYEIMKIRGVSYDQ
jgi:TrmH family RNA methyltransferase